jgi:hypothetical protein
MRIFKIIGLSIGVLLILISPVTAQDRFAKYPKIEGYEVRPGILAIPRYTANNELCEIGLQRLLYSSGMVRLNVELDQKEILNVIDELVPAAEKGAVTKNSFVNEIGATLSGGSLTTGKEFDNVLILMFAPAVTNDGSNRVLSKDIVAQIIWKNRKLTAPERFAKYPKIEGYEIRPGVLAVPTHTADNELCEIGLQRLLYSSCVVRLNVEFDQKEFTAVVDELVPKTERGAITKNSFVNEIGAEFSDGGSRKTGQEFDNIFLFMYSPAVTRDGSDRILSKDIVARVKWKHRTCRL